MRIESSGSHASPRGVARVSQGNGGATLERQLLQLAPQRRSRSIARQVRRMDSSRSRYPRAEWTRIDRAVGGRAGRSRGAPTKTSDGHRVTAPPTIRVPATHRPLQRERDRSCARAPSAADVGRAPAGAKGHAATTASATGQTGRRENTTRGRGRRGSRLTGDVMKRMSGPRSRWTPWLPARAGRRRCREAAREDSSAGSGGAARARRRHVRGQPRPVRLALHDRREDVGRRFAGERRRPVSIS